MIYEEYYVNNFIITLLENRFNENLIIKNFRK